MKDARARKFDGVVVARFDRFARSVKHLVLALEEFNSLGIHFISLNESIDTSTPMGKLVLTVLGAVAELERRLIVERINMGLYRARRQKKQLGRPKAIFDREKARQLQGEGKTIREIAAELGASKSSARAVA